MINATALCKTVEERKRVEKALHTLEGVRVDSSVLAIAVEYTPPDTATDFQIDYTTARLFDIIESVETHGICIS